jgi:YD repeat-containing protein
MTEVSASADSNAPTDVGTPPQPVVAAAPAPSVVPPAPITEEPTTVAAVEWDHTGRVISSRFTGGHISQFRYDSNGSLYGFSYARLAWHTLDGFNWTARDNGYDYEMSGKVEVGMDGAITIDKGTVTRTLKLSGVISDCFTDGSIVESVRDSAEPMPGDLLASWHPRAAVREPQMVMEPNAGVYQDAGTPPGGVAEDSGSPADESRCVVAGGRRMNFDRLKVVEEKAAATVASYNLVEETKAALDDFVTTSAIRLLEMTKGEDAPELPPFLDKLATVSHRERRVDEARVLHERALAIRVKHFGADHSDTGFNLHGLGKIYLEWGRYVESEQYLLDAVKVFAKALRKAKFMVSAEAAEPTHLGDALTSLINGLHSLASLYHEQNKLHLCSQLHESAVSATNSVPSAYRSGIDAALESLAAMAVQAEMDPKRSYQRIRARL